MDEAKDEVFLKNLGEGLRKTTRRLNSHSYVSFHLRGPFAKFVDSLYYSESELYGGAVTVSFSKYLPWQAMHFLQRSTHFPKTCCRPLITSKFLASELPLHGRKKPRNRMRRDLNWILCSAWKKWIGETPLEHPPYSPDLALCDFWAFPTVKRELRGKKCWSDQRSAARFRELGGAL
jgi:hypothetical protein